MDEDFFLFPWRMPPILTGVFFFAVTVGAVHLLHMVFKEKSSLPGGFLRTRWVSFWFGDPLIAIFAIFASVVIGGRTAEGFPSNWWLQLILLATGLAIFVGLEVFHVFVDGGPEYKKVAVQPSQRWHTVVAGLVFYEMVWGLITAVRDREPSWAFILAMIFVAGYAATVYYDNFRNPLRTVPVTLEHR